MNTRCGAMSVRFAAGLMMAAMMALIGARETAGAQGDPLGAYRGKNPVLLLFAPDPTEKQYTAQRKLFDGSEFGFGSRRLVRFDLFGPGHVSRQGNQAKTILPASRAEALRARCGVPASRFVLVLIGKDGAETFRSERPITVSELLKRIDAPPMRRPARMPAELPPPGKPAAAPGPKLTPMQVVWAQLGALQHNDQPHKDSGITTTFAFASPNNRRMTGPLPHFIQIVKNPQYFPMFQFKTARFLPPRVQGDRAVQAVKLIGTGGQTAYYMFQLSRQHAAPYKDCWMTDGVFRIPGPGPGPVRNRNI